MIDCTCGARSAPNGLSKSRMNGCSRAACSTAGVSSSSVADQRALPRRARARAPAAAASRWRRRWRSGCVCRATRSSRPPIVASRSRAPSSDSSISCGYSRPRMALRLVRHIRTWNSYSPSSGKGVRGAQATHRAERHTVELVALRPILPRGVGLAAGAQARVADGDGADLPRRREVGLQQRRRRALRVGHVVEAERRGVGGQQRRDVHVETEQIADGVGVLGAVQAMERGPAGIGAGRGRGIERPLRATRPARRARRDRDAARPAAA